MLKTIKTEVIQFNNKIIELRESNAELKNLYRGCQIYFSPYIKSPDLMLIGINPGGGYYKFHNNQIVQKFDPQEVYEENYNLAQEIKFVFREVGIHDIFKRTFKTNMYFFATDKANQLKEFFELLPEEFRIKLKEKSVEWIKLLVNDISPKLILCEGHTAFDMLKSFYKNDMNIIQNKGIVLEAEINNTPVIGCQRMGSTIIKAELLINKLKEYYCGQKNDA
jgi:hypothetical protein